MKRGTAVLVAGIVAALGAGSAAAAAWARAQRPRVVFESGAVKPFVGFSGPYVNVVDGESASVQETYFRLEPAPQRLGQTALGPVAARGDELIVLLDPWAEVGRERLRVRGLAGGPLVEIPVLGPVLDQQLSRDGEHVIATLAWGAIEVHATRDGALLGLVDARSEQPRLGGLQILPGAAAFAAEIQGEGVALWSVPLGRIAWVHSGSAVDPGRPGWDSGVLGFTSRRDVVHRAGRERVQVLARGDGRVLAETTLVGMDPGAGWRSSYVEAGGDACAYRTRRPEGRSVDVVSLEDGRLLRRVPLAVPETDPDDDFALSAAGDRLAIAHPGGRIEVWDVPP